MTFPDIDTDDLVLFGSLAIAATGAALAVASTSGNLGLAFGVALLVFGIPAVLIAFMAAAETNE